MPKLRHLSGQEVISIMSRFGFVIYSQKGSHVKLRRLGSAGRTETLTIPNHPVLDTGTCRAILRQASRYIPEAELRQFFYTE